jgi:hypothetical protein
VVTGWLNRRTVPQYALILWVGGELCILLVIVILTWIGDRPFNVALFVALAVVLPLVGLPGPLLQHRQRLRASRDVADTQN